MTTIGGAPTRREMLQQSAASAMLGIIPVELNGHTGITDITQKLEQIRVSNELPALASITLFGGHVVALGAAGVRKIDAQTKVTVHDKFHLGSCTKALTAHLCATLMEEGKLHRNTLLKDALPDMAATMHPVYRSLTLDHLLSHQSGFPGESWLKGRDFQEIRRLSGSPSQQRAEYLRYILQEAPVGEPGKKYLYSNRNYSVAGVLAERAAGEPWEALMQRKLFRPLNINNAGFGAMGTPGTLDQPWQHVVPGWNGEKITIVAPGPNSDNPAPLAPGGTAHMPLGDWAKFAKDHLDGLRGVGGELNKESYQYLHTPLFGGEYMGGWIAVERSWAGGRVYTHTGSNTQNFATIWLAPIKNFAVMVMTNQGGGMDETACNSVIGAMVKEFLS